MRPIRHSTCVLGIVFLLTSTGTGRSGGRFELDLNSRELPEMGTVTRCLLSTDKGVYCFMPPHGWRIELDPAEKKLNLTSAQSTLITIRSLELGTESKSLDSMRDAVMARYPEAKIIEETVSYTEGAAGRTFDLELRSSLGTRILARLTYVPINGEMIEFQLTARPDKFRGDSAIVLSLLTSFQVVQSADRERQHAQK